MNQLILRIKNLRGNKTDASLDPDLIDKFNKGEDVYIYCAKIYLGEEGWNKLNDKQKKKWRKAFKTILLGLIYGLGRSSLAERIDATLEEADHIIKSVYDNFPRLREYVKEQGDFPLEHNGYINTMLGDKLKVREWDILNSPSTPNREKNNLRARIQRLGVNLPIQGGTSAIMQHGFFNNIRKSIEEGWEQPLQPIITVH